MIKSAINLIYISKALLRHELWKKNRLIPLLRFIRLQLIFALGEKKICLEWFKGIYLNIEKGDTGLTGNYYLGLDEFYDMGFLIHSLKEKDTFLDVGSNLGSYSLLASGLCKCSSIAYEPVPITFSKLIKNINIQNFRERIIAKKIALTSIEFPDDNVLFSTDRGCCNSVVDEQYQGDKELVMVSNLDKETENISPNLLKIDVEGFENMVLRGAENFLNRSSLFAIIIEGQTDEVNNLIRSKGFTDYNYSPLDRKLIPHQKVESNRIWIRDSRLKDVTKRIQNAPLRRIYGQKI